jgi:hypothetical protein
LTPTLPACSHYRHRDGRWSCPQISLFSWTDRLHVRGSEHVVLGGITPTTSTWWNPSWSFYSRLQGRH